jgi:hypothetical protein
MTNHYQIKVMRIGLTARMGVRPPPFSSSSRSIAADASIQLIGCIFRKSLRLSGKARAEHSAGQITTVSRPTANFPTPHPAPRPTETETLKLTGRRR